MSTLKTLAPSKHVIARPSIFRPVREKVAFEWRRENMNPIQPILVTVRYRRSEPFATGLNSDFHNELHPSL